MNCSFTEKMRRVEYRELDEAKLLQDQVNNYKQTPWNYDKEVSWYTAKVSRIIKIIYIFKYKIII
jgi:hypothetical protein